MSEAEDKPSLSGTSTETEGQQETKKFNQLEWVLRLVVHVLGASLFLLPRTVRYVGLPVFTILMTIESYVTGRSLCYFFEMAQANRSGGENPDYFRIVEDNLCKKQSRYKPFIQFFVRGLFVFDAWLCTSIYFRVFAELTESWYFTSPPQESLRLGYYAVSFIFATIFLLTFEYGERFLQCLVLGIYHSKTEYNFKMNKISQLNFRENNENPKNVNEKNLGVFENTNEKKLKQKVLEETHHYNYKRPVLFFIIVLLIFVLVLLLCTLVKVQDDIPLKNISTMCPGVLHPNLEPKEGRHILHVMPVIIFSLMNYAIILPICNDNLKSQKYACLVAKSKTITVVCLTSITLLVSLLLGDSTPVIFPTAFGPDIYGKLIGVISIVITLISMLLRVMACCRLIQALLIDNDSEMHYWVVVITLFFASFIVAAFTPSVVYLVILTGSINCNLLLIILPRIAYISFKTRERQSISGSFWSRIYRKFLSVEAAVVVFIHVLLAWETWQAIEIVDSIEEDSCRYYFEKLFSCH